MGQPQKKLISHDEYFAMEEAAEYKSEYYHGEIFAMSGASHNHNMIAGNIFAALHSTLRDSDCVVYISDMKVQIDEARHYTYPDVSIVCGDIGFAAGRNDTITNPAVIIEILSESTKDYDRGGKLAAYRKIASLLEYILIDQYSCHVEYFFKNEAGIWESEEYKDMNDSLKIRSADAELALSEVYYRVKRDA
ncbi:Uma2 family endonuclease [Desulfococcaceae bacterium HSG8]|nr:Uma2 family endonuclease [Desulfococcaceae bacterium HSG8]